MDDGRPVNYIESGVLRNTTFSGADNCHYTTGSMDLTIQYLYPKNEGQWSWTGYSACSCNMNTWGKIDLGALHNISQIIIYMRQNRDSDMHINWSTNDISYNEYDHITLGEVQALPLENRTGGNQLAHAPRLNGTVEGRYFTFYVFNTEAAQCDFDIWSVFFVLDETDALYQMDDNDYIFFNTSEGNMTVYGKNITDADPTSHINEVIQTSLFPLYDANDSSFYLYYNFTGFPYPYSRWNESKTAVWTSIGLEEVYGSPTITIAEPSPQDGDVVPDNYAYINITGNQILAFCDLTFNGTVYSMVNATARNFYFNVTNLTTATYTYSVTCENTFTLSDTSPTILFSVFIPLGVEHSSSFCHNDFLYRRNAVLFTISGVEDDISIERYYQCFYGCSNSTIVGFGNPGCVESDMLLAIVTIIVILIVVLAIRRAG
jgi:hypothetical protein